MDMNESRLEIAKQLGSDAAIIGVDNDTEAAIKGLTNNRGVEVILDFAGFDSTIEFALKVVRKCRAFGLIGAG
ncbi:zinc-binding dehydrogenase [Oceanobacillus sp. APA_J-2(6-2)]|nr:zinc-binding dehydrogenase [Oceanobacillus alkalisoli]